MIRICSALALVFLFTAGGVEAGLEEPLPSIAAKTAGTERMGGFFPLYWDEATGKVWLEVDRFDTEFLYVNYLSRGLGSNDVGLDRGQIGDSRVVRFVRAGPRVLLVQPNYAYRAVGADADARRAVAESFARSVLWGFSVVAVMDSVVLVDATDFFLADAHDVAGALRRARQGAFRLAPERCAVDLSRTRNFPLNTEVEALLTWVADSAGAQVREVAPTPTAVTLQLHHSLVALPDAGYRPRAYDLRSGFFSDSYDDFAAGLDRPAVQRFIARHRLEKADPSLPLGPPKKPIVYYVDRGAPEPIRTAIVEGASWWAEAFRAAGFTDAFQVKLLPEDADPLDLRYNVIQWVHRSTRGWSYGGSVIDPRTGEILKGQITLGSLRARQDYLIAEGILDPYRADGPPHEELQRFVLARIRQLAAHEVGHTLGLRHNYAASTRGRASVMDYPYPLVRIAADGSPDLSDAYAVGIGSWDRAAIIYGYAEFAAGTDEAAALQKHLDSVYAAGERYLSDQDARPEGSASPYAHLWDNGADAVDELYRLLDVRRHLLARFGTAAVPARMPLAQLEETLVPIYLFHRYQIEAAAKVLGGQDYRFAVRGSGDPAARIVPPALQRRALDALLTVLAPDQLALPDSLLLLLQPNTTDLLRPREIFARRTGDVFDPLTAAEGAADLAVRLMLNPERATRLELFHARDAESPGLTEVIERLLAATWKAPGRSGYPGALQRVVDDVVRVRLCALAVDGEAGADARVAAMAGVNSLAGWIDGARKGERDAARRAQLDYAALEIARFLRDPARFAPPEPATPPAGSPIGQSAVPCDWE